ncbi:unnamed protein product [Somion occarium]|uniref:O-methyltransferase domain-containing protein n=1 Tax=Somion occarium TaxID=3059160 RepID=A0ABP1DV02_9APHY
MTFATLRALHALIGSAIDDIESVYRDPASPYFSPDTPDLGNTYTPPYTPPQAASPPSTSQGSARPSSALRNRSPSLQSVDDNALLTPVSIANFSIPPPNKRQERRVGRERAYTLPPIAIPPVFVPPHLPKEREEVKLDFPSLDEPRYVAEKKDPNRRKLDEDHFAHPQVIAAINQIVAACGQLSASVQKPFLVLCDAAMGYHLPACLRFLEASHIVEILREAGENGLHVKQIAKRIRSVLFPGELQEEDQKNGKDIDPGKLSHILRLLATHHITREVRPDVFANNRISSFMDSGKDVHILAKEPEKKYEGTDGTAAFIGLCTDELFKASAYLTDCYLPSISPPTMPPSPTSPLSPSFPSSCPPNSPIAHASSSNPPLSPLRQSHAHKHSHSTSFSSVASSYGDSVSTGNMPPTPSRSNLVQAHLAGQYQTPSTPSSRHTSTSTSITTPPTPSHSQAQYTPPPPTPNSRLPSIPQSPVTPRQRQTSASTNSNGTPTTSHSSGSSSSWGGIARKRSLGTLGSQPGGGPSVGSPEPPPTPSSPVSLRQRIPLLRRVGSKPLLVSSGGSDKSAGDSGHLGALGSASTISLPSPSSAKSLLGAPFSYSSKSKSKSKSRSREHVDEVSRVGDDESEIEWEGIARGEKPQVYSKQPSLLSLKSKSPSVASFRGPSRPTISTPSSYYHLSPHVQPNTPRSPSAQPSLSSLRSPSSMLSLQPPASPALMAPSLYSYDDPYPSSQLLPSLPPPPPPRSPLRESPSLMSVRSMVVGTSGASIAGGGIGGNGGRYANRKRKDSSLSLMTSPSSGGSTTSLALGSMNKGKPLPPFPPASPISPASNTSSSSSPLPPSKPQPSKLITSSSSPKYITPTHPMHAPFNLAFRTSKPYFDWLEEKGNQMRLRRFGKAMTGTGGWEVTGAVLDGFPWHDLSQDSIVVDVGGGIGSTSMLLAKACPHLRFVIQDRPQVVEMGLAAWKTRSPELLEEGRAAFLAHDFLSPQPPIPIALLRPRETALFESGTEVNAPVTTSPISGNFGLKDCTEDGKTEEEQRVQKRPAVFLLRVITHDWPDAYVTRILLQLRKSAGPDTKLLLADYILPLACVDEDSDDESVHGGKRASDDSDGKKRRETLPGTVKSLAPEGSPLLPNLGKANANAYWLDLTMRVTFNAQERTLRELTALTLTAGWKVVQVTRAEGSLFGHVIAVPVDIPEESLALLNVREEMSADDMPPMSDLEVYSPPMGDTFFSNVNLPSEDIIRSRISKRMFKGKGLKGLGLGAMVASASENLGLKSKSKVPSVKSPSTVRKRSRAYTVTGASGIGDAHGVPIPPLPLSMHVDASEEQSDKVMPLGRVGDTKRGGWKTLVRMLSKPQLSAADRP